LQGHLTDCTG